MDFYYTLIAIFSGVELFILAFGLYFARSSIESHKKTEKLKSTLTILYQVWNNLTLQSGIDVLGAIENKTSKTTGEILAISFYEHRLTLGKKPKKKNDTKTKKSKYVEEARILHQYLGTLEDLCIGMKQGIYDEETCKLSIHNILIQGWDRGQSFIIKSRKLAEKKTLYQELETIARKWQKEELELTI